ncbi:MAG: O-methyltransferase [Bacteroidota bacterium]
MQIVADLIEKYMDTYSEHEDALLKNLYRETQLKVLMPHMCSGHVQGQLLYMLTKIIRAQSVLEIGTFTGYATICFAKGIQENGVVDTIDINKELSDLSTKYFRLGGYENKINLLVGNALEIIPSLDKKYDLVFIDADKQNYSKYYDIVFDMVNPGGLIIADNILWKGEVTAEKKSKDAEAMHQYNKKTQKDTRVESIILSIRDGLNIARKK